VTATQRDAQLIRAEIEQARDQLALTVDQLATRLAPARLVDQTKEAIRAKLTSPTGKKVLAGGGVIVTLIVIRNIRRSHRRDS